MDKIMYPKYTVVSPIGNRMREVTSRFLDGVRDFDPPPEMILCAVHLDHPFDLEDPMWEGVTVVFNPEIFVGDTIPPRIAVGREILRRKFVYSDSTLTGDYMLTIDSDMYCPPETFRALYEVMEERKLLVVANKVPMRGGTHKGCGNGCVLIHRAAASVSQYYRGWFEDPEGSYEYPEGHSGGGKRWSNLSADNAFYGAIQQAQHRIFVRLGRKGRICEEFFEIEHDWGTRE